MQTEIPEDVMKAAEEALDNLLCNCKESCGGTYEGVRAASILDIARAIMAERERGQWQLIETAPKDGTGILAYNPLMGVYNTAYQKSEPDERDRWPCGFSGFLGKWYCWPTHWMPKPSHPRGEA